jgi:hypothetical protein
MEDVSRLLNIFIDNSISKNSCYSDIQKMVYEIIEQDEIQATDFQVLQYQRGHDPLKQ